MSTSHFETVQGKLKTVVVLGESRDNKGHTIRKP